MLDYSIIIPVFNKAAFTKRCLETLPKTLEGAGTGEVIVIDNASSDETPEMLKAFSNTRVVRNDVNLGFAGANNQGARLAQGRHLVLLNNDTQPLPGWLASMLRVAADPGVGAVGARLLFPDKTVQHAGVVMSGVFFSKQPVAPYHLNYRLDWNDPLVERARELQAVTGACLLTPRELYLRVGGLDESFWNGYEDVDYCLKVRREGLRVVYDGGAALFHFESQSGAQRFRRQIWNGALLEQHWADGVRFDTLEEHLKQGQIRHAIRGARGGLEWITTRAPGTTVLVHDVDAATDRAAIEARLRATTAPIAELVWLGGTEDLEQAQEAIRIRGLRYAAFVHAKSIVHEGWLTELIRQVEATTTTGAATFADFHPSENTRVAAPDARCTLFSLVKFPAHVRLRPYATWDAVVADFALQALPLGVGTRGTAHAIATIPAVQVDDGFAQRYKIALAQLSRSEEIIEPLASPPPAKRGLVSIITLSWNAPEFTKIALDSIRAYTSEPYEVIVVDNGSGEDTLHMLRAIDDPHVRVIYNATNRGFAGGNNDALAAARGEYVILLNNDVIVTEGWVEGLLRPFERIGALGVTAPRSNKVVGHQVVYDATYQDESGIQSYARERARRFRGRGYVVDRAIGFCLCISRAVLNEVGGLDESFGAGNFEDDDYCTRVRAAGYKIYVCDDVFIHHFGSQSFAANKVDYMATMRANWQIFAKKWGYPAQYPENGYQPRSAILRGFDYARHYVPIHPKIVDVSAETRTERPQSTVVFWAEVDGEKRWERVAPFVRRYLQAFSAADAVELHLTVTGEADPELIARRVERAAAKIGLDESEIPEIVIADEIPETHLAIAEIADASPSALRRLLEGVAS